MSNLKDIISCTSVKKHPRMFPSEQIESGVEMGNIPSVVNEVEIKSWESSNPSRSKKKLADFFQYVLSFSCQDYCLVPLGGGYMHLVE